jgi:hypothetical protein
MPSRTPLKRGSQSKTVRQNVTIPAPLAAEVRRVAKERHVTMSRALVALAERGIRAELEAKQSLHDAYSRFTEGENAADKQAAGKDLIRSIFGKDSVAEDPVL